jgi:hypothetical protein
MANSDGVVRLNTMVLNTLVAALHDLCSGWTLTQVLIGGDENQSHETKSALRIVQVSYGSSQYLCGLVTREISMRVLEIIHFSSSSLSITAPLI